MHIPITTNNFKIKLSMIQNCCQFFGLLHEDLSSHISKFLQLCDTIKINGVSDEAIQMRLFGFSLNSKAWTWLQSHPTNHFMNWSDFVKKFLTKYILPSKTIQLKNRINNFQQFQREIIANASMSSLWSWRFDTNSNFLHWSGQY